MFKLGAPKEVDGIELSEEFIETYKKLLLKAAKKHFGDWVEYNPNERIVNSILIGLFRNMVKYGHAYCPCRVEKIREHICPCEPAKEELQTKGICHCKLFINPQVFKKES